MHACIHTHSSADQRFHCGTNLLTVWYVGPVFAYAAKAEH